MLHKILSEMNTFISSMGHLQNCLYGRINCYSFVLRKMSDSHKFSEALLGLLGCYNVSFVNSHQSTRRKIPEDLNILIMYYFVCTLCILCT